MCWKKKMRLVRTVKFRTALWYSLLFATSSLLLFLGIYHTLKARMITAADRELLSLSRRLEDCYVSGEMNTINSPRETEKLPAPVRLAAKNAVPGLRIKDAWRERNETHSWYEIIGVAGRKNYDLTVSTEGKVLELEERLPENRIRLIRNFFNREVYYVGVNRIFFRLIAPDGNVLAQSDGRSWEKLARERNYRLSLPFEHPVTMPVPSRSSLRIVQHKLFDGNILETAMNLRDNEATLRSYWSIFAVFSGILVVLSFLVGWIIAARTMRGVERVSRTAAVIGQGDFSRRVAPGSEGQEITDLVVAFNTMLSRIEALIFDLKEVSDNVAHDLRTPLTRIRGMVETTVQGGAVVADYEQMAGDIVEECDRLIEMINTMLEITRTDAGTAELHLTSVDLAQLVRQAHELFMPLAENKNIVFRAEIKPGDCRIRGDLSRLQRAVANLLDNAVKYTPASGEVTLSVMLTDHQVRLVVADNGPGISTADQRRIFDRFFRCDNSRSLPGNGLGLSLVKAIVNAHHGELQVTSTLGSGSVFTLIFPRLD